MTEIQGDSNCQNCQKQSKVGQNYPKLSNIVKEIKIVCSTIPPRNMCVVCKFAPSQSWH